MIKYILILLLFFTSCVTQKKCEQKFPPTVTSDTVVNYVDTTVYVSVPIFIKADTVSITDTIDCETNYSHEIKSEGKTIRVNIKDKILKAECFNDSLTKVIDSLEVKIKNTKTTVTTNKVTYKNSVGNLAWSFLIGLIIGVMTTVVMLIKKKL